MPGLLPVVPLALVPALSGVPPALLLALPFMLPPLLLPNKDDDSLPKGEFDTDEEPLRVCDLGGRRAAPGESMIEIGLPKLLALYGVDALFAPAPELLLTVAVAVEDDEGFASIPDPPRDCDPLLATALRPLSSISR